MTRSGCPLLAFGGFCMALALACLLCGCATAPQTPCPPLKPYTTLEQAALADELPSDGPETRTQIVDYLALREACRKAR